MRRLFGGRQPLCGTGVTSAMLPILRPSALSARTADSRPGPGPLMRTSRFFTPHSCAALPADSAATCAANGVDLREPLNPAPPDVAHDSALPCRSVIVMIVLLNDAWMCAIPSDTLFFTFLRARVVPVLVGACAIRCFLDSCSVRGRSWRPYLGAGLPAGLPVPLVIDDCRALRGPLRVRALVRVRWPRTGSPLRCRTPR